LTALPPSIRSALPPLKIAAHVWSEEPSLRLLSVDGRMLHEGGEAAPGVVLREITSTGAVFESQGQGQGQGWRFSVDGAHP